MHRRGNSPLAAGCMVIADPASSRLEPGQEAGLGIGIELGTGFEDIKTPGQVSSGNRSALPCLVYPEVLSVLLTLQTIPL